MEARRSGTMFSITERKELSTHNPTPSKNKGELKKRWDEGKLREFFTKRPTLKEWLMEFFSTDRK